MRAETTKAVTELLAQMTATLNRPSDEYLASLTAIHHLSAYLDTQVRMAALPSLESPTIHWVGSTMVV